MEEWYYQNAGTEFGPVSEKELRTMLQQGGLTTTTQVRRSGSDSWTYLGQGFAFPSGPATPPPVPVAVPALPASLWVFALLALIAMIVLVFFRLVFSGYALLLLAGVSGIPEWCLTLTNAMDAQLMLFHLAMFVLLILWQGCAFASLRRLYDAGMVTHGRGSGFWWIVPIASLFMPFLCLREMRWLSRERQRATQPAPPAGVLLWLIQVMLIVNILASLVNSALTTTVAEDETLSTVSTAVNLCSNACGALFVSLMTAFILRNLIQQVLLYRRWHLPPQAA